ncbi:sigma 54-interacting transcriptional regulator [Archangium sp.]|uniref:sigma 54-interacting transcriptional regulator n=1 Tax=Archangium sp. TaxID=1872627 RepID=UPI003899B00D
MREGLLADVSTAVGRERGEGARAPRPVAALTVISHPMPQRVGERFPLDALDSGKQVPLSRNAPDFLRPGAVMGLPLADPFLSRRPILFAPGEEGRVRLFVDEGGTKVVAGEPLLGGREFSPEELASGVPLELAGRVVVLLHLVDPRQEGTPDSLGMVGESVGTQRVRQDIAQVADLDVPVLIRGETGTGKELVAQAIHARSKRRSERFVSVNLGAIPRELAAAELFGARKGSYTGATREREGFFRAAQGGTLFLDEVGEASPEVQVMLLRVLETGEMYPVGDSSPVSTDVRLIAATDANLEEQIRQGRFKAPLMHRLAGYGIRVPPLRERREDLGLLLFHFAREELEVLGESSRLMPTDPYTEPWLPASLVARLVRYSWPGNIRQLRNLTRQLVIASRGQRSPRLDHLLEQELQGTSAPALGRPCSAPEPPAPKAAPRRKPSEVSERELLAALREHSWDFQAAAEQLGIPRPSIYDLIDKSPNIRTAGELSAEEITRCHHECRGDLEAMVRRLEVSKRALRRRIKELGLESKGP